MKISRSGVGNRKQKKRGHYSRPTSTGRTKNDVKPQQLLAKADTVRQSIPFMEFQPTRNTPHNKSCKKELPNR
eukprot:scaffold50322_cov28-Attheya_sp.AAC.1